MQRERSCYYRQLNQVHSTQVHTRTRSAHLSPKHATDDNLEHLINYNRVCVCAYARVRRNWAKVASEWDTHISAWNASMLCGVVGRLCCVRVCVVCSPSIKHSYHSVFCWSRARASRRLAAAAAAGGYLSRVRDKPIAYTTITCLRVCRHCRPLSPHMFDRKHAAALTTHNWKVQ